MTKFYDTSALLDAYVSLFPASEPILISLTTLRELEHIKTDNKDPDTRYKARKLLSILYANPDSYEVVDYPEIESYLVEKSYPLTNDNRIMACAILYEQTNTKKVMFVTSDLSCHFLATHLFKLASIFYLPNKQASKYTGYIRVTLTDAELADFYTTVDVDPRTINSFDAIQNQYIILENSFGTIVDLYRWNGEAYVPLKYKTLYNAYIGNIMPVNIEQKLAFDLLQNSEITIKVLAGKYGTGKDFCMMSHALSMLKAGEIQRVVWIRNGVKVKDAAEIGLLPGSANDKMLPYAMPMADYLGGKDALNEMLEAGSIELENLGALRGRSWDNTIIYCSEAENFTKEHIQLLIGRVGKNTQLWINGDYRQVDGKVFEANNGLMMAIERLKGQRLFGFVKLHKVERSDTAALADLLD